MGQDKIIYTYQDSPIGIIEVGATNEAVFTRDFVEKTRLPNQTNPLLEKARTQLLNIFLATGSNLISHCFHGGHPSSLQSGRN